MSSIVLDHVRMVYPGRDGGVLALNDISLSVEEGQFGAIVGASGCGKSTLLNIVGGLVTPTGGEVRLDNQPIDGPGADRGMVFQSYTLYPWKSVRRNIEFGLALRHVPKERRRAVTDELIAQVGLEGFADAYPKALSGGMKQRVAIARALANDPRVLLMDEPFGALDAQTRVVMQELLLDIWERSRKTVLFVTHDIDEAILLSDVVYVLSSRPGTLRLRLPIDLDRPRSLDTMGTPRFAAFKRQILEIIHRESLREAGLANRLGAGRPAAVEGDSQAG
ncbi:MAG TPA: ABC transporter ATP-binding protein [Chloroflexota bacterium]|jgi:NitT/TauT family transport system ATP-binding protein